MHDESLISVDMKQLEKDLRQFAGLFGVSEASATLAMGYVIKLTGKILTPKESYEYIRELTKTKQPQDLDNDERLMMVALGLIQRKTPFKTNAKVVGRNAPCPCNSGAKFKNCCLELAKAHDHERFYTGR
jgi:hypothetical protein